MTPLQLVNQDGRRFVVRLVRKREAYGAEDDLVHDRDEPLIEFFDAQNQDEESDNPLGYFTGIRCRVGTFFATIFESGGEADALFNEHLPMWNIGEENIQAVRDWISGQLQGGEAQYLHAKQHSRQQAVGDNVIPLAPRREEARRSLDFEAELYALIEHLDRLEPHTPGWRAGRAELRLHLLAAKQQLLEVARRLTPPQP